MREQKTVTKTLSLKILRPYYEEEIEKEIKAEKEKQRVEFKKKNPEASEEEIKKAGQIEGKNFYKKLSKKYPHIVTWEILGALLTQLQKQVIKTYNQAISELYAETIGKGNAKGIPHYLSKIVYPRAMDTFKNSYIALGIRQKIQSNFRAKELIMQKSVLPTASSDNFPIPIYKQLTKNEQETSGGFEITEKNGDLVIKIPFSQYELSGNKYEPFIWKKDVKKSYIELMLATKKRQKNKTWLSDEGTDAEIKRVMSGELKVSWIEIKRGKTIGDKNCWFVNMVVSVPINEREIDPKIVGGIDIGVKSPLVCAVSNSFARLSIGSNDVMAFSKQTFARRRVMLKKNAFKRSGHGSANKLEPITRLTEKNDRFRKKILERWAKEITNFFTKNKVGTVRMEDLSGMKDKEDQFFRQYVKSFWPYAQMQSIITNKLKEYGVNVEIVPAKYTSQVCSSCNERNESFNWDYRKNNKFPLFECKKCSLKINPDYNAARNLANPKFHEIFDKFKK